MNKQTQPQYNKILADILPIALIFLDQNLTILSWNPTAQRLFALNSQSKQPQAIEKLFSKVDFQKLRTRKKPVTIETVAPQHPEMDLSLSLIDYHDQQYVLIIRDITQIHRLETMRQDFVANVSHELRTPLTVFHGYLEMLLETKKYSVVSSKKILSQMYQQSLRMEKLIDDLLLLSRLENITSENPLFKKVQVADLLTSICKDAEIFSGARQHKLVLDVDTKLIIYGLENELQSAFSNIIINAVNYTPANGTIWVKWHKHKNHALLAVTDTGIGIAPEHIPRLTERFYRVDKARSRSSGGTGLGLAIVKHVLILHKAQLQIISKPKHGSTFICQFPLPTNSLLTN